MQTRFALTPALGSLLTLGFALLTTGAMAATNSRPNVVFVLVDDLGWTDLGCYGSTFYDTPHLDAFAKTAVRFSNGYAASPVCSPTRAAIMSGKNPVRLQITDWIPGMIPMRPKSASRFLLRQPAIINQLPHKEVTIAETLRDAGYQTFYAGKWHLGETEEFWPLTQGFDINKGGHSKGSPPGGYYAPYNNPVLSNGPDGEYLTDRLGDESVQFIENRDKEKPFLLYLAFYTVHTPIQGCNEFDAEYEKRAAKIPEQKRSRKRTEHRAKTRMVQSQPKYAAMVRSMDKNVGKVLDALEEQGLADNTLVIFTSDNGGLSTQGNGGPTSVLPLRAGKGWCYEGGTRVPLIIRAPGVSPAGTACETPAISMDMYPTILEYAGLDPLPQQHRDGMSLVSQLRKPEETQSRTMVWHFPHYHGSTWAPGSSIRDGDWKLVEFYESEKVELFDLANDLEEQKDLATSNTQKAAELKAKLHEMLDEMGALYPEKNPDYQAKRRGGYQETF